MLAQVFCRVFVAVTSRGSDEEMEFLKAISQRQCGGTFGPLPFLNTCPSERGQTRTSSATGTISQSLETGAFNQTVKPDMIQRPRLNAQSSQHHSNPASYTMQLPKFAFLKRAVAALGEDSPHASFLLTATNAARAKLNVSSSVRIESSEKYLERARNPTNSSRGRSPRSPL